MLCSNAKASPLTVTRTARKSSATLSRGNGIDRTKLGQNARPTPGAFGEAPQIVLLIRRMDTVILEGKADQERVHAEPGAERLDNGNRTAAADHHRLFAPFFMESAHSGLKRRRLRIKAHGG